MYTSTHRKSWSNSFTVLTENRISIYSHRMFSLVIHTWRSSIIKCVHIEWTCTQPPSEPPMGITPMMPNLLSFGMILIWWSTIVFVLMGRVIHYRRLRKVSSFSHMRHWMPTLPPKPEADAFHCFACNFPSTRLLPQQTITSTTSL